MPLTPEQKLQNARILDRWMSHEKEIKKLDKGYIQEMYQLKARIRLLESLSNGELQLDDLLYFAQESLLIASIMLKEAGFEQDAGEAERLSVRIWEEIYG